MRRCGSRGLLVLVFAGIARLAGAGQVVDADRYDSLQLAVNAAFEAGGGTVSLGPRVYEFSEPLTLLPAVSLRGLNASASILRYAGSGTAITVLTGTGSGIERLRVIVVNPEANAIAVSGSAGTGGDLPFVRDVIVRGPRLNPYVGVNVRQLLASAGAVWQSVGLTVNPDVFLARVEGVRISGFRVGLWTGRTGQALRHHQVGRLFYGLGLTGNLIGAVVAWSEEIFFGCDFEGNVIGAVLTDSADSNKFIASRFEANILHAYVPADARQNQFYGVTFGSPQAFGIDLAPNTAVLTVDRPYALLSLQSRELTLLPPEYRLSPTASVQGILDGAQAYYDELSRIPRTNTPGTEPYAPEDLPRVLGLSEAKKQSDEQLFLDQRLLHNAVTLRVEEPAGAPARLSVEFFKNEDNSPQSPFRVTADPGVEIGGRLLLAPASAQSPGGRLVPHRSLVPLRGSRGKIQTLALSSGKDGQILFLAGDGEGCTKLMSEDARKGSGLVLTQAVLFLCSGDVLTLLHLGGKWRQVAFSDNSRRGVAP